MLDSRVDWGATSLLQNVVEDAGREVIQDHCVAEISTDPAAVRRLMNEDQLEKQKDNPNVRRKIEISFKPSNNAPFAMQYVSTYFLLFVMSV